MSLPLQVQTIGFFSHLRSNGVQGCTLVVGPLSTLTNWVSEVERWCPSMPALLYHGTKQERAELRRKRMPTSEKRAYRTHEHRCKVVLPHSVAWPMGWLHYSAVPFGPAAVNKLWTQSECPQSSQSVSQSVRTCPACCTPEVEPADAHCTTSLHKLEHNVSEASLTQMGGVTLTVWLPHRQGQHLLHSSGHCIL